MGNCLNCAGVDSDSTNLLTSSTNSILPVDGANPSAGSSYHQDLQTASHIPSSVLEQHQQEDHSRISLRHSTAIGVSLASQNNQASNKEEHHLRIAKRIGLIQHLPTRKFDCLKKSECVICMMELLPGEEVRYLPCMHTYHTVCIDDWLLRSLTCPTCMEPVDAALINSYHPMN